jgi:hypothetical protein
MLKSFKLQKGKQSMQTGNSITQKQSKASLIVGWTAVSLTTIFSSLGAWWGGIENFHEGWFYHELWRNLALMMVQYLAWMFVLMIPGLLALWNRAVGIGLHFALAGGAFWFFGLRSNAADIWIISPLLLLGLLYGFGRPAPVKWARRCILIIPVLTLIISGAEPGWRVFTRPTAVDHSAKLIAGNGVALVWAPEGPGWPENSLSWFEAQQRCRYLKEDGVTLASEPVDVWRLPTADEAVRTMIWRGRHAGGQWDEQTKRATYQSMPDKEAPLWDRYSQIIYWWTASERSADQAYKIAYNGSVNPAPKKAKWGYLGCRCVKDNRGTIDSVR